MSRPVTIKELQVHDECICGRNSVYQDDCRIPHRKLKQSAKRKIDKKTRKVFYILHHKYTTCECYEDYED